MSESPPTSPSSSPWRWLILVSIAFLMGTFWAFFGMDRASDGGYMALQAPTIISQDELPENSPHRHFFSSSVASSSPTDSARKEAQASQEKTWSIPAAAINIQDATRDNDRLVQTLGDGTKVTFTLDPRLQEAAMNLLKRFQVERGAIVAMVPKTGEILVMAEYAKDGVAANWLSLSSASPAASIFKVITAAALLEGEHVAADDEICVHGGQKKLELYNLKPNESRDRKCESFAEALGSSNNVAFARWADQALNPRELQEVASKFYFNKSIPFFWATGLSRAKIPRGSRLGFARTAAGFENTTLSPLHAAMISAAIANDGKMMRPELIQEASLNGQSLYHFKSEVLEEVLSKEKAKTLLTMMESTITSGTGSKFFDSKLVPSLQGLQIAGKSGSLSGRMEGAQRHFSWFIASAGRETQDIAVAALIIQGQDWTIKGAFAVRELLKAYYE